MAGQIEQTCLNLGANLRVFGIQKLPDNPGRFRDAALAHRLQKQAIDFTGFVGKLKGVPLCQPDT